MFGIQYKTTTPTKKKKEKKVEINPKEIQRLVWTLKSSADFKIPVLGFRF